MKKLIQYFLLLKDKKTISVNTFENNELTEIKTYPIAEKSLFTTDQKRRIAILDTTKNTLSLHDIEDASELQLPIPFKIKPITILLNDDNLFIGGVADKEILIQYHIQTNKWHSLEIPKEIQMWKRAIDDLLINDRFLIVIDNILMPKYALFYHLNPTRKLIFSHFKSLKLNGTYEEIHQGRISSDYLGLISTTANHGRICEHITIYNDLVLANSFAISVDVTWRKTKSNFNDFLFIKDKLVIANKEQGMAIFKIENSYFEESKRFNEDEVNYKQYENEEVIKLTKIPNNDTKIVLTIRNKEEKIRHEVVEMCEV